MPALLKLWVRRLVLFLVVTLALVYLVHLPAGVAQEWLPDQSKWQVFYSPAQYWRQTSQFWTELASGGIVYHHSDRHHIPFMEVLHDSWQNTGRIFAMAVVAGGFLGVVVGSLAALRSRVFGFLSLLLAIVGLSLPDFLVVMGGQVATLWTSRTFGFRLWPILADPQTPGGWVLPVAVLSLAPLGYMARLTAAALDEILREDYIRTARSKGLAEFRVIFGHAFRNALPRLYGGLPSLLNVVLSSVPVVEQLTTWPGLGKWLVPAGGYADFGTGSPIWIGVSPAMIAMSGMTLVAMFMVLDGVAQSLVLVYSRKPEGVRA